MQDFDSLYLVVTSNGNRRGLAALTRALHGKVVPKALAMITVDGSLLQRKLTTFRATLTPKGSYAILLSRDEAQARAQIVHWPDVKVVAIPEAGGVACGLLSVLVEILAESPQAEILVVSAESYVADPRPFIATLARARAQLGLASAVVLGTAASCLDLCRPWLVPGARLEKAIFSLADAPVPASKAERQALLASGAMWSTSTFVARGHFLLRVLARALPEEAKALARGYPVPHERADVLGGTADTSNVDVEALLLRETGSVAIARVEGGGWNDWRNPDQVFHSLRSPFELAWLLSRLAADAPARWFARAQRSPATA